MALWPVPPPSSGEQKLDCVARIEDSLPLSGVRLSVHSRDERRPGQVHWEAICTKLGGIFDPTFKSSADLGEPCAVILRDALHSSFPTLVLASAAVSRNRLVAEDVRSRGARHERGSGRSAGFRGAFAHRSSRAYSSFCRCAQRRSRNAHPNMPPGYEIVECMELWRR